MIPFLRSAKTVLALLLLEAAPVIASEVTETPSADGLAAHLESTNVVLKCPSHPEESFIILSRSNVTLEARWVVLTNRLRAAASNQTTFHDIGGLTRVRANESNLVALYRVFVIPDFWFDMNGQVLEGGPQNCGEDYLPIYYGTRATGWERPEVTLLVDGESFSDVKIERINFGTLKEPLLLPTSGFWFWHAQIPDGRHRLQLVATLSLNGVVGDLSQTVTMTNEPVWVTTGNAFSRLEEIPSKGSQLLLKPPRDAGNVNRW